MKEETRHGYGNLTNLITLKRVWMTRHQEGTGNDDSPIREVLTFFDEEGKFLHRKDAFMESTK